MQTFKHFGINLCSFLTQSHDLLYQRDGCDHNTVDIGNENIPRGHPEIPLELKWYVDL